MISIISPAKTMDSSFQIQNVKSKNFEQSILYKNLIKQLYLLDINDIKAIMKVSDKIAELNYQRYQKFEDLPSKQAIYAYDGDVYRNIDRQNLSKDDLIFAQIHLRIISGLYGLLKPLDQIKAYRLEMITKLAKFAPSGLSKYWQDHITNKLNIDIEKCSSKYLINIASNEYVAAVDPLKLNFPIINIFFLEEKAGVFKNIAINAKKARGMFANYIITNKIDIPKELFDFNIANYKYNSKLSDDNNYYFVR